MEQKVNPAMLTLAREAAGLTQSELARIVSISQGNISRYESGSLEISDAHLERIAEQLGRPLAFFCQTDRVYGFGSACLFHRKRASLPITELRKIHANVNVIRMQVDRLLRGVEIDCENKFHRLDLDEYDGDVEHIARLVRSAWNLPLGPIKDLVGAIEEAGGIVQAFPFNTNKIDAVSQWPHDPPIPPLFFINSESPGDRLRYTLAHELGHVIMHAIPTSDMEREADRFAAEFLMPAREILPDLSQLTLPRLAQLKSYWRVSMSSLILRAFELGKISEWKYKTLISGLSSAGYRKQEPVPIPREVPTLLRDIVEVYFKEHEYDVADLAKLVNAGEKEVRARYLPDDPQSRGFRVIGS